MRFQILFASTLIALTGCREISSEGKACTLVGSSNVMHVRVTSPNPILANLAVSLNGSTIDADECSNSGSHWDPVVMSADRRQAEVVIFLDGTSDFEDYFPSDASEPQSNVADFEFYNRATCSAAHSKFDEVLNAAITWEPVYANGEDCGASSYAAEADVQVF